MSVLGGGWRIDKIKSLCDALINNFQANYLPGENLAVDETMVGFRGRFGPKQYMPNKPTKYGIKACTLASSDTGYLLNLLLYIGAETLANADPVNAALPHQCCDACDATLPQQRASCVYRQVL